VFAREAKIEHGKAGKKRAQNTGAGTRVQETRK
jgi:hypothetical protein